MREVVEEVADHAARIRPRWCPFARWITPPEVSDPLRHLLLPRPRARRAPRPIPDGSEIVDARWFEPARALEGAEAGELLMVFPTIKNLEVLARFDSADALLEWASTHEVRPVQPRVEGQGEAARIVLDEP